MAAPFITTLPNGMTLILKENHRHPWVELLGVAKVGAVNETDELDGCSHFLEHLMFKGTKKLGPGELSREVTKIGGTFNAMTSNAWTVYTIGVATEHVKRGLELHADQIQNSILEPGEVDRERKVVQEEIRISLDHPIRYSMDKVGKMLWTRHNLRRTVLGSHEIIGTVPRDKIWDYYQSNYVANNMAYVMVGDFQIEDVLPQLEKLWGKHRTGNVTPYRQTEPAQRLARAASYSGDVQLDVVALGLRAPARPDSDYYAYTVLNSLLYGGKSSRLHRELVLNSGLAVDIVGWNTSLIDVGQANIFALSTPDKDPEAVKQAMTEQMEALRAGTFDHAEFEMAKAKLLFEHGIYGDRFFYQVISMADDFCCGGSQLGEEYLEGIRQVEKSDVVHVANAYMDLDHQANWVFYLPEAVAKKMPAVKTAADLAPRKPKRTLTKLKCGLPVVTIPDPTLNLVYGAFITRQGSAYETAKTNGITGLTLQLMLRGTKKHPGTSFNAAVEALGGMIDAMTAREGSNLRFYGLPANLEPLLELFVEALREPEMDKAQLEMVRKQLQGEAKALADNKMMYGIERFHESVFGPVGYGLLAGGSEESLAKLTMKQAQECYAAAIQANDSLLVLTGPFDEATLLKQLNKVFTGFPKKGAASYPASAPALTRETLETNPAFQTIVTVGFPGPKLGEPVEPALKMANMILGGSMDARLFRTLRDVEGLAYTVFSRVAGYEHAGLVVGMIGTSPDREQKALDGMKREFALLGSKGITKDELATFKAYYAGIWSAQHENILSYLGPDFLPVLFGFPLDYAEKLRDDMLAVTLKEVNAAAKKYFRVEDICVHIYRGTKTEGVEAKINE